MNHTHLFIRQDRAYQRIRIADIVLLETVKNYTQIHLLGLQKFMVRCSLARIMQKLPTDRFVQIHRAIVVATDFVDIVHNDHVEIGDATFPMSKNYLEGLMEKLNVVE